jgi:hypothetical protein
VGVAGATLAENDGWLTLEKMWTLDDVVTVRFTAAVEFVPYPTGQYTVRHGALQYVLPIEPEYHIIKDYALPGFHDYDIVPKNPAETAEAPQIDRDGWQIEIDAQADRLHPWDRSPLCLKRGSIRLVPIGCTILRQAAFHLKEEP